MNWKVATITLILLCILNFGGGYYMGRKSITKSTDIKIVEKPLTIWVRDTLRWIPDTFSFVPDTSEIDSIKFNVGEYADSSLLIITSATRSNSSTTVKVNAYAKCAVERMDITIERKPTIIEREKMIVISDTIRTERIIVKPGLKEKITWAFIGSGITAIIILIAG